MKDYLKPEAEYVKFVSETITGGIGTGTGSAETNTFGEDDFH